MLRNLTPKEGLNGAPAPGTSHQKRYYDFNFLNEAQFVEKLRYIYFFGFLGAGFFGSCFGCD